MKYELSITRVWYPKNDTSIYSYGALDRLLEDLKKWIKDNRISKNDIIRIERVFEDED